MAEQTHMKAGKHGRNPYCRCGKYGHHQERKVEKKKWAI